MSPLIKFCVRNNIDHNIIHTQQHYSADMDMVFFENLKIRYPNLVLNVKSKLPHIQVGEIILKCGNIFIKHNYDIILVQGDTNSVLGASIAAKNCGKQIGHVEAGLRSFDRSMPEEINRMIADDLSDYWFVRPKLLQIT